MNKVKCENCGKTLYRSNTRLKKYKHHFCGRECYKAYLKNRKLPKRNLTEDTNTQAKLKLWAGIYQANKVRE